MKKKKKELSQADKVLKLSLTNSHIGCICSPPSPTQENAPTLGQGQLQGTACQNERGLQQFPTIRFLGWKQTCLWTAKVILKKQRNLSYFYKVSVRYSPEVLFPEVPHSTTGSNQYEVTPFRMQQLMLYFPGRH